MSLPDTCPGCGIDTSPATVRQDGEEGDITLTCVECGATIDAADEVRVNYKGPVMPEEEPDE